MADKNSVSFDDIIQADRLRRKNEALANEIFGRGRRSSLPNTANRRLGSGPSFASRVGIAKLSQRSASSKPRAQSQADGNWGHDTRHVDKSQNLRPLRREKTSARATRNDHLYEAITSGPVRNGANRQMKMGEEITIRGLAGPYVVIGSNFAPGTTAEDIESAMIPSGGEMESCKIIALSPVVVAEMVFAEKSNAENVIATFNNKKADGRILHIYMKHANSNVTTSPVHPLHEEPGTSRADLTRSEPTHSDNFRSDYIPSNANQAKQATSEPVQSNPVYDSQREQSDRNRRRADPEFQDGSYGFETKNDQMDIDNNRDTWHASREENSRVREGARPREDRRLYSDNLYSRPRGRGFR